MNIIPSANNKANERRERRAHWKQGMHSAQITAERINRVGKAIFEMGCVSESGGDYKVTMAAMRGCEPRVFIVADNACSCGGNVGNQDECEHILAVKCHIAQNEIEDFYNNDGYPNGK